jgi:DNA-binding transcriptional LysR family regulator
LRALAEGELGVLRIGCYQSVGTRLLPRVLREVTASLPGVRVELTEAEDDEELLHLVESGALDLTFVVYPMIGGPFTHIELLGDPYVAVVHRDSEFGQGNDPVRADQLAGLPIITYSRMREVHSVEHRLGRPEIADQILLRSEDNGTLLGLAAEGVGIAVVSWLSVDPFRTDVRVIPLAEVAPRVVGLAWHRDRYRIPASEEFIRVARREAARLATESVGAHRSIT